MCDALRADDSASIRPEGAAVGADAEAVTRAVFRLIDRRVSAGEVEDVVAILPRELRALWPRYMPTLA